jgi:hypothetical protein
VNQQRVDFMAIQETKMENIEDGLCFSLWGSRDCDWVILSSTGNSGGIISL